MQYVPVTLDHGRIVVDRWLRVHGLDDVWALGDDAIFRWAIRTTPKPRMRHRLRSSLSEKQRCWRTTS